MRMHLQIPFPRITYNKSPFRELRNEDEYFRTLTLQKGEEFHNFVEFIFGTPHISRDVCPVFCAHVPIPHIQPS
jgi:hypothetical protein